MGSTARGHPERDAHLKSPRRRPSNRGPKHPSNQKHITARRRLQALSAKKLTVAQEFFLFRPERTIHAGLFRWTMEANHLWQGGYPHD